MKKKFIDRSLIISFIILSIIYSINIIQYILYTTKADTDFNTYSFWQYVREVDMGQIVVMISIFIVAIGSVYEFYTKLHSGYIRNELLRQDYKEYTLKNILKCYLKSLFILPLTSLLIFVLGYLLFEHIVYNTNSPSYYVGFKNLVEIQPSLFVLLSVILNFLFSIFIINLVLIVSRKTNKFYITMIVSFIIINVYNFILNALIFEKIYSATNIKFFLGMNIYTGYVQSGFGELLPAFCIAIFNIFITSIIMYILYRNKEDVVLNCE